jgi:hypothetical protein
MPDSSTTSFIASSRGRRFAILAIRGYRIQTIHRRQDTRANGNLFSLEPIRIAHAIPFFVMRPDDRSHWIGEGDFSRISAPTIG